MNKKLFLLSGMGLVAFAVLFATTASAELGEVRLNAVASSTKFEMKVEAKARANATGTSTRVEVKQDMKAKLETARIDKAKARAKEEITRRIAGLTKLMSRVNSMKRVSDTASANISAIVQAQIDSLKILQAKIEADTDLEVIKADIQSIKQSYRIYALVMPMGHILASADKVNVVADSLNALADKLSVRIEEARTAGIDVTVDVSALADLKAKTASAKVSAAAAVALVSGIKPDQGDETVFQAMKQTLKDAQAKIRLAESDLKIARKDAQTIVSSLKKNKIEVKGELRLKATTTRETKSN